MSHHSCWKPHGHSRLYNDRTSIASLRDYDRTEDLPCLPFSLKDICMLNIVFFLDDFPVQVLAALPPRTRRQILLALPIADILHLMDTGVMYDVRDSVLDEICLKYKLKFTKPQIKTTSQKIFGSNDRELLESALTEAVLNVDNRTQYLPKIVAINLLTVCHDSNHLDVYECGRFTTVELDPLFRHVRTCFPSAVFNVVGHSIPRRFKHIVNRGSKLRDSAQVVHLLQYCHLPQAHKEVHCRIGQFKPWIRDTYPHLLSMRTVRKAASSRTDKIQEAMVLRPFWSGIETLHLSIHYQYKCLDGVAHILLYNIITSGDPQLKHLILCGYLSGIGKALAPLFCDPQDYKPPDGYFLYNFERGVIPPGAPYRGLEGISLRVYDDMRFSTEFSAEIVPFVAAVLQTQRSIKHVTICILDDKPFMHSLKNVVINTAEYKTFISTTLVDLVKRPQFTSLHLGAAPLPDAYQLIEAFLITPATHEQTLSIIAKHVIRGVGRNVAIPPKISQSLRNLPESNPLFKCLDVRGSDDCVGQWLLSIQQLKLKSLAVRGTSTVHYDMMQNCRNYHGYS